MKEERDNSRLLLQDCDRKLFRWFLNKVDSKWVLRNAMAEKVCPTEVIYTPKGSMCISCSKRKENCTNLPFHEMKILEIVRDEDTGDKFAVVLCTEYVWEKFK